MLSNEVTGCPHCGDTQSGYRYLVTQKYEQNQAWGNDAVDSSTHADTSAGVDHHGACRCNNCNKIVKPREL
jgi:hypothetical protein